MNWRFSEIGWRSLSGAIAGVLMTGLIALGFVNPFEQVADSALFRLRGERQWDDRLVLVAIDDDSIKQIGRFPWKRTEYVELIERLTQADASVIAIDLLFSEPTPEDAPFAAAIAQSNRVILAQGESRQDLPLLPVPKLQTAAVGIGHIRILPNEDGITRSIEPQVRQVSAFGLATVMAHSMLSEAIALPDLSGQLWLNWVGRVDQMPHYSFARVIRGEVPESAFRNKIVLVGVTAAAIDTVPTPFDRNPLASGVHLQATLIHNLLQGNLLTPIAIEGITLLIFVVGGMGFSVLLSYWSTRIQLAIAIVVSASWIGISVVFLNANTLLPVVFPIGLILNSAMITLLIEQSSIGIKSDQSTRR